LAPKFRFLACLAFFLLLSAQLWAQEIPVNIKADELRYLEGTDIVEAHGGVEIRLNDLLIRSNHLSLNSATNIATAEGNVKIETPNYSAWAELLTYNATSEATDFVGFKTQARPNKKVKGTLYLKTDQMHSLGNKMAGSDGKMTTCDYANPHYYIEAGRVEYYPNDAIVGYNVTFYIGEMPVLWLPVMYYSLRAKQQTNWNFGHNDVEGDYLKSGWAYPLGILYLDLMQKKGFGYGTKHYYGFPSLGSGSLYVYHLDEQDTSQSDWVTRLSHQKQLNPFTTLTLNHSYVDTYLIPSGRKEQTNFDFALAYKNKASWNVSGGVFEDRQSGLNKYSLGLGQSFQGVTTSYNLNYDQLNQSPWWIRASQRFYHKRPLWSDNVVLTTTANYYSNVSVRGAPADEKLEPKVTVTGKEKDFSWTLVEDWYLDLDQDTYRGDDNYQYLVRQPELVVTPNPVDLKLATLRPKFGYGFFREVRYVADLGKNRDYSTQRYQATLDLTRAWTLPLGTVANLNAGLDQFLYGPGDQLYAYREGMNLRTNLFNFFSNNITYGKGITDGNTPFLFDRLGRYYHNVSEQMSFYHGSLFRLTIDGGHNWQTHEWFDVMGNLSVSPSPHLSWGLRSGWSLEQRVYRDLVNSLVLRPVDNFSLTFSSVSDLNVGGLKSGSAAYDLYFLKDQPNQWHIKFNQIFELATQQFKVRDIMVVKDLHCWVLTYTYSDYRKEFSLTFSLKAMPDKPLGFSTGKGFYMEGFEEELKKEFETEGAVRRY